MLHANLLEVESLRVQSFVASYKALPSREEPDISLSIVNSKACFILVRYAHNISPKHCSALNTCKDFIRRYIECLTSHTRKNHFGSRCEVQPVKGELLEYQSFIHGVSAPC